jgi:DNA-binding transcriptional MerR regulator
VHPEFIERLIACGLIRSVAPLGSIVVFEQSNIRRLQSIRRLRNDLGINLQGVAAILDLLEKLQALQHENASLTARL